MVTTSLIFSTLAGLLCSVPLHAMQIASLHQSNSAQNNCLGLLQATENNLLDVVDQCISLGVDVNTAIMGATLLHRAAELGHLEVVNRLLRAGALITLINKDGLRPLDCAIAHGHKEIIQTLQTHHLCEAIKIRNMQEVELLLSTEIDVNRKDTQGYRPLHYASARNYPEIASLLLQAKAFINAPTDNADLRPLHIALFCGHIGVAKLLLQAGANTEAITSTGQTALHIAAQKDSNKEAVQALLDAGANTLKPDYFGCTPLMVATNANCPEIKRLLQKKRTTTAAMIKAVLSDRNSKSSLLVGDLHTMINDMLIVNAIGEAVQALKTTGAVTEEVANDILSNTGKTLNESAKCLLKEQAHTHSYSRQ